MSSSLGVVSRALGDVRRGGSTCGDLVEQDRAGLPASVVQSAIAAKSCRSPLGFGILLRVSATPDEPIVQPWKRYGHDRLYVQASDGRRLGYWDNATSTAVVDLDVDRAAFDAAIALYRAGEATAMHIPAQAAPAEEPPAGDVLPAPCEDMADLALTRPGAAAREQAEALKEAAPVRTFLARVLGVKTDERAWRIGADAEEAVAARLAKLGDEWKVLHAIPVGENGSDIDHVVIGPAGVFTINTKHHPNAAIWVGGNTFMVDGAKVPYIRNSRFEARRTAKFLTTAMGGTTVTAVGLIAVMGAGGGFKVKSQPPDGDVVVLTRRGIATWLSKQTVMLTPAEVDAIYAVARRPDTWR
jgi:hypothetical protein